MGKKNKKPVSQSINTGRNGDKQFYPLVSVCTPTFNRRPFIENMFRCFRNQDYPKHRIEWIIVDDGTDKIGDLVEKSGIQQIRYFRVENKMTLGAKRNYMHQYARGSIIVYMDDDDYYPPERISHAVQRLQESPSALCAGASEIYIYFKGLGRMVQCGPYGPNHATAGTFAFKTELLKQTKYEEHAALAEERAFLKDYTIPFVQLDTMKTILVFSHEHNTFDKRKMLENPHPQYLKDSPKTVDDFIRHGKDKEKATRDFFMLEIDKLLLTYEPGSPQMKPDVMVQMKEIEEKRKQLMAQQQQQNQPIVLQQPGQPPVTLSSQDVVNIMSQQQKLIQELQTKATETTDMISILQKQLLEKVNTIKELNKKVEALTKTTKVESIPEPTSTNIIVKEDETRVESIRSKSDPEINIQI
jgi:Glycosyl transferase family 2